MVRIGISVEGTTEERFVKKVLSPYLEQKNIFITPISIGGGVKLDKIKSELKKIARSFNYVTTFYDFYGFQGKDPNETKQSLENKILLISHATVQPKLIPYVQMYEFEGLLFTCPQSMQACLKDDGVELWAQTTLDQFGNNPEVINDSPKTAPSKRLLGNTRYKKTIHGPDIAELIGVPKLRQYCSGFNDWLTAIEALQCPS